MFITRQMADYSPCYNIYMTEKSGSGSESLDVNIRDITALRSRAKYFSNSYRKLLNHENNSVCVSRTLFPFLYNKV